jgi:hypothetical protein
MKVSQELISLSTSSLFNGSLLYWYGINFLLMVPRLPKPPKAIWTKRSEVGNPMSGDRLLGN